MERKRPTREKWQLDQNDKNQFHPFFLQQTFLSRSISYFSLFLISFIRPCDECMYVYRCQSEFILFAYFSIFGMDWSFPHNFRQKANTISGIGNKSLLSFYCMCVVEKIQRIQRTISFFSLLAVTSGLSTARQQIFHAFFYFASYSRISTLIVAVFYV